MNNPASADDYGVLKVSAVGGSGFEPSENKRIIEQEDFLAEYQVRRGDLLITRCNTPDLVGRVCIVGEDYPTLMLCDKTLRLDPNDYVFSRLVLLEALRTYRVRRKIMGLASGTGGAMKNVSQNDIREIPVAIPELDGQRQVHQMFNQCHLALKAVQRQLSTLHETKVRLREKVIGEATHDIQ